MEMFGNGITEFSLHRYHYGMEILATKKDVLKITEDLSRDGLFAELKKRKTGWNFCIGYGFAAGIVIRPSLGYAVRRENFPASGFHAAAGKFFIFSRR